MASALADARMDQINTARDRPDRAQLLAVLRIFPDCVDAWRALWQLDRSDGSSAASADAAQLRRLLPLDPAWSTPGTQVGADRLR
jgi:hypothetical protein